MLKANQGAPKDVVYKAELFDWERALNISRFDNKLGKLEDRCFLEIMAERKIFIMINYCFIE